MPESNSADLNTALRKIDRVLRDTYGNPNLEKVLSVVAIRITNRIKEMLSEPGSGRLYRRGRGVAHRASAPGMPPSSDTGRLRSSYGWKPGTDAQGAYVEIGTNVEYAPYLEFGTRRMAPRPHLRRAISEELPNVKVIIARELVDSLRRNVHRQGGTG